MRAALYLLGFVVGIGGVALMVAAMLGTAASAWAWLSSTIATQRARAREYQQPARRREAMARARRDLAA